MLAANKARATETLASAAHKLKSMSLNVGASRMAELLECIEAEAREGAISRPDQIDELTSILAATIPRLFEVVESMANPPFERTA
jgi:two-component system sensor histidine kinase BarA